MFAQKALSNFQKFRNVVKAIYYSIALIIGLMLGIFSGMLAGFSSNRAYDVLGIFSSIYITSTPVVILLGLFYLLKLMFGNLGLISLIEKSIYRAVGRIEGYQEFAGERENKFMLKNFSENYSHFAKWTLRSILFVVGITTCVPFFTASAMTVATMPAPTIIAFNMLILGTIIPLLLSTLLCEAIIYSIYRVKKTITRVEVVNSCLIK